MAKYRPIFTRIWKDPDFEEMDAESKLIFIYLCTNELTTDSGIYSISFKTISNETGIPLETVRERLTNGSIKNLLYDEQFKYVFVVKFKKYNAGGKPKLVERGIVNDFKSSNCTYLWSIFIKEYPKYKDAILTVGKPLENGSGQIRTNPKPNPKPRKALFTSVNKAPGSGGHFSDQLENYAEPIIKNCKKILKLPQKNGKRFNPFQWVQSQTKNNIHPGAILETVEALANPKHWQNIRDGPWAYATAIIKTKNGNWNERSHIAEAEKFKETWISPEVKELIKNIGS